MRGTRICKRPLGVAGVVIESVVVEDGDDGDLLIVAGRRLNAAGVGAGLGGLTVAGLVVGGGHLDFAAVRVYVEAAAPRVNCPEHGPTTLALPWALHASRFTTAFEGTAAWLTAGRRRRR